MSASVDLERLAKVFTRRGERVVLVVPGMEPVVLVPLSEYERLTSGEQGQNRTGELKGSKSRPKPSAQTKFGSPEQIDPLPGGLEDDNQYFPEPL